MAILTSRKPQASRSIPCQSVRNCLARFLLCHVLEAVSSRLFRLFRNVRVFRSAVEVLAIGVQSNVKNQKNYALSPAATFWRCFSSSADFPSSFPPIWLRRSAAASLASLDTLGLRAALGHGKLCVDCMEREKGTLSAQQQHFADLCHPPLASPHLLQAQPCR